MDKPVACVGDVFVDMIVEVPILPRSGDSVWCPPPAHFAGGTAANVASGLATLGTPVSFHGRVGDDPFGTFLTEDFEERGVGTAGLIRDTAAPTGRVFAMIEAGGERSMVVCASGAAHTRFGPKDLELLGRSSPAAIYLTGVLLIEEPSRGSMHDLVERYRGEATLYFDPNLRVPPDGVPPEIRQSMAWVSERSDVVLVGESEVEALDLRPADGQLFVVKCGARGARIETPEGIVAEVDACEVDMVQAIGAGDTFDAAFIAAQRKALSDRDALGFANAAAALSVTKPGARSTPTWKDAEAFWRRSEVR